MFIDTIFIILLATAVFKGFSRGLIMAILTFVAYIVGLAAAMKLSSIVANSLQENMNMSGKWLPVLSFLLVFIAVILLVRLGGGLIKNVARVAMLGWVDKVGGIIFYFLVYMLIYSVILFYASKIGLISAEAQAASATFSYVAPFGPSVIEGLGKVLPIFSDMFKQLTSFFDNVAAKGQ